LNELCDTGTDYVSINITKLFREKEYRSGCLMPCGKVMFDLVVAAETTFRQFQHQLLEMKRNVKQQLVQKIADSTTDIHFISCHNVKDKLIKRFVNARLQFFAKRQSMLRKTRLSSCHEMSSKSMQMRKCLNFIH